MVEGFPKATQALRTAMESQALVLVDGRGASLDAIGQALKDQADKGTLVLIDYIQRLPTPKGVWDSGYTRVKEISDRVLGLAAATETVILAGAQFHRSQDKEHPDCKKRDTFDDTSFRESGDLEQDAHCALGLGWWKDDPNRRFFEVLKAREGAIPKQPTELIWFGSFQYMAYAHEISVENSFREKPSSFLKGGCHR
jgi:replicative DNA helicase